MKPTTRCKEYRREERGRLRTYKCIHCGEKFSLVLLRSLPQKARLCYICRQKPELKKQFHQAFEERDRKERNDKG